MRKFCNATTRANFEKRDGRYIVESESIRGLRYMLTTDDVSLFRDGDLWIMSYPEAYKLLEVAKPVFKNEFQEVLEDAKYLKSVGVDLKPNCGYENERRRIGTYD